MEQSKHESGRAASPTAPEGSLGASTDSLRIERLAISSLVLDPANARVHGIANMEAIKGSLGRFGQAEPLVVQKSTGVVIGGNGRLVAMKELGWTECDVVQLDVDGLDATALGIALNRTSDLADSNPIVLAKLLDELRAEDSLDGIGYSTDDLDSLLEEIQAGIDANRDIEEDEVPAPPEVATTRRGDLWILGDHRLLCGDSASPEDLDTLLGGEPIHLINMDPPYNVKVEPRSNNAIAAGLSSFGAASSKRGQTGKMRAKDRPLANDFVSDEAFEEMLRAWFGNASRVLLPGRSFYIWGGYSNFGNYPPALAEAGFYFSQAIIWLKEHPVLTRKDFMGNFEVGYYGWKIGAGHSWFGPNNAVDVWSVKKLNHTAMVHLTEKPVELAARAMQYSSKRGENVLDLFGGSGSTMAAAEQSKRHAFSMEIDGPYCDVIVERWQNLTGQEAILEGAKKTFGEVREERSE